MDSGVNRNDLCRSGSAPSCVGEPPSSPPSICGSRGGRQGDEGEEKARRLARGRSLARHCRSAPPTARLPTVVGASLRRPHAAHTRPLPLRSTPRLTLTDAPTPPSSASLCTASPVPRTSSRCPSSQLR